MPNAINLIELYNSIHFGDSAINNAVGSTDLSGIIVSIESRKD